MKAGVGAGYPMLSDSLPHCLILHMNLFVTEHRITDQCITVQIFTIHVHTGDLMIFVCGIIVDSCVRTTAGSIEGNFIVTLGYFAAATLLIYRS